MYICIYIYIYTPNIVDHRLLNGPNIHGTSSAQALRIACDSDLTATQNAAQRTVAPRGVS